VTAADVPDKPQLVDTDVMVPADAETERIDASVQDGILTVRIPKPERTKPRHIEVQEKQEA
jgi:HSP20 family molecular chaperone IbpA